MTKRRARRGEARAFIENAIVTDTDDCILWPFGMNSKRNGKYRHGVYKHEGRSRSVHRVALILHTGIDPEHLEACHEPIVCHNSLCINIKHLRWDTPSNNAKDRILDGTSGRSRPKLGADHHNAALTEDQVLAITADTETSNAALGRLYNVSRTAIRDVRTGQSWGWLTNITPTQPKETK